MHDIRLIRENPEDFDQDMKRRNLSPQASRLLSLDSSYRATQTAMQEVQAKRNDLSRQVGEAKRKGEDADALMAEVAQLKDDLTALEEKARQQDAELKNELASLPNRPEPDVPFGLDEAANVELRRWGTPAVQADAPQHFEIGEQLGLMDFEAAARMSGARFTIIKGALARLERAIGAFMLDLHTGTFGYTEVSPPILVRDEAAFGTAQLPKFREDLFQTTNGYWLIPTAEVTLTNMVREQIIASEELPLRFTARTACFRSEAGSAGKDTRGMLRQHQFYKVELVSITTPDQSKAEHERMTACAEEVLKQLEIPFRTIILSTCDMGFSARKTYDIEAWLPGQKTYREISSCSNCWDFQARRMNARCRAANEKSTNFVHTLNGSGLAIGRCLIAVMENYLQPDGSIAIPTVLKPYMGGLEKIEAVSKK